MKFDISIDDIDSAYQELAAPAATEPVREQVSSGPSPGSFGDLSLDAIDSAYQALTAPPVEDVAPPAVAPSPPAALDPAAERNALVQETLADLDDDDLNNELIDQVAKGEDPVKVIDPLKEWRDAQERGRLREQETEAMIERLPGWQRWMMRKNPTAHNIANTIVEAVNPLTGGAGGMLARKVLPRSISKYTYAVEQAASRMAEAVDEALGQNDDKLPPPVRLKALPREEWEKAGERGIVESMRRLDVPALLPFSPSEMADSGLLLASVNRLRADDYSEKKHGGAWKEYDQRVIEDFLLKAEEDQKRGTIRSKVVEGVSILPGFMLEFLATGGMSSIGKAGIRKFAAEALEKSAGSTARKMAIKGAARVAGGMASATLRTPAMASRLGAGTFQRQIPTDFELTDEGRLLVRAEGDKPFTAFLKATGDTWIEMFSETAGGDLARIPGLRKTANLLKGALKSAYLKTVPGASLAAWRKMGALFTKVGYSNLIEEMGEERVGGVLRAVTGVEDFGTKAEGYSPEDIFKRIVASIPNGKELLVEGLVLSVPMAAQGGVAGGFALADRAMTPREPAVSIRPEPGDPKITAVEPGGTADDAAPQPWTQPLEQAVGERPAQPSQQWDQAAGEWFQQVDAAIERGEEVPANVLDSFMRLSQEMVEEASSAMEEAAAEAATPQTAAPAEQPAAGAPVATPERAEPAAAASPAADANPYLTMPLDTVRKHADMGVNKAKAALKERDGKAKAEKPATESAPAPVTPTPAAETAPPPAPPTFTLRGRKYQRSADGKGWVYAGTTGEVVKRKTILELDAMERKGKGEEQASVAEKVDTIAGTMTYAQQSANRDKATGDELPWGVDPAPVPQRDGSVPADAGAKAPGRAPQPRRQAAAKPAAPVVAPKADEGAQTLQPTTIPELQARYKPGNPFSYRAAKARYKATRLSIPTPREQEMAKAFPLGVGGSGKNPQNTDRQIDASVRKSVEAVKAIEDAKYYEAQAAAFDAGQINAQGRSINKESQARSEKREINKASRDDRQSLARREVEDKEPWGVTADTYATSLGYFAGSGRDLIKNDHRAIVAKALADGKPVPAAVLADYPELQAPAAAPTTADGAIEAGEELTYNRRGKIARRSWEDFADLNAAMKAREVQKGNVWTEPDYQGMIDGGSEIIPTDVKEARIMLAHVAKQVRDAIASKPATRGTPTDADFQRYVEGVRRVEAGVARWLAEADGAREWLATQGRSAGMMLAAMRGERVDVSGIRMKGNGRTLLDYVYQDGWKNHRDELIAIGGNRLLNKLQPGRNELQKAMIEKARGWPAQRESWQVQGYEIIAATPTVREQSQGIGEPPVYFVELTADRKDGAIGWTRDKTKAEQLAAETKPFVLTKNSRVVSSFDTEQEALDAAREATKRKGKSQRDVTGTNVGSAQRSGPPRRIDGEDVDAEKLKATTGLRGVNFGDWMKGPAARAEAQAHLNFAFDSLLDLAEILGIPEKALSFDGMLGLAIGAQGSGKAVAHFVPGANEINITRTGGAGALSHEWAHALDHYFARMAGLESNEAPYITEHANRDLPGVRAEVAAAFKSIVEAMRRKPATEESLAEGEAERKAANAKAINGWLRRIRADYFEGQEAAFDVLADRVRNGDFGAGRVDAGDARTQRVGRTKLTFKATQLFPVVDDMRQLYREKNGRMPPVDKFASLQSWLDAIAHQSKSREAGASHVPQTTKTQYLRDSESAQRERGKSSKPYWNTPREMFARAFDAYISDKLHEMAAQNSYLAGIEVVPPLGEERKAINAAFDTLIGELKTRETERGVAMYGDVTPVRTAELINQERNIIQEQGDANEIAIWENVVPAGPESSRLHNATRRKYEKPFARFGTTDIALVEKAAFLGAQSSGGEAVFVNVEGRSTGSVEQTLRHELFHVAFDAGHPETVALAQRVKLNSPVFNRFFQRFADTPTDIAAATQYAEAQNPSTEEELSRHILDFAANEFAADFYKGDLSLADGFNGNAHRMRMDIDKSLDVGSVAEYGDTGIVDETQGGQDGYLAGDGRGASAVQGGSEGATEGTAIQGGVVSARGRERGDSLRIPARDRWQRGLDRLRKETSRATQLDVDRINGIKVDVGFGKSTEFRTIEEWFRAFGYETIPAQFLPYGAVVNRAARVVAFSNRGRLNEYYLHHELAHIQQAERDPEAVMLADSIDLSNPVFTDHIGKLESRSDDYKRNEFAAALVGGMSEFAVASRLGTAHALRVSASLNRKHMERKNQSSNRSRQGADNENLQGNAASNGVVEKAGPTAARHSMYNNAAGESLQLPVGVQREGGVHQAVSEDMGSGAEGRDSTDSRYLELARDPVGNAAELQRMVDEAAERKHDALRNAVTKRNPKIGETIKFIRFGKPVKRSTRWTDGARESGMSVYSLNAAGAAEQVIRSEFGTRTDIYIGTGEVVGQGSDGEPLVDTTKLRNATTEEAERAEYYGLTRKEYLSAVGRDDRGTRSPVTYDDAGNIIPLSQRFAPASADIRYGDVTPDYPANFRRRPDLANPGRSDKVRSLADTVDAARTAQGEPGRESFATWGRRASVLLRQDGDRLWDDIKAGQLALTSPEVVLAAKELIESRAMTAFKADDKDAIVGAALAIWQYRRAGTEIGRTFASMRDMMKSPKERAKAMMTEMLIYPGEEIMGALNKAQNRAQRDKVIARWWSKRDKMIRALRAIGVDPYNIPDHLLEKPEKAAEVARTIAGIRATTSDKIYEYWINSILSAPTTQAANIIGNAGNIAWEYTGQRFMEATTAGLARMFGKDVKGLPSYGEIKFMYRFLPKAMAIGGRNAVMAFRTEQAQLDTDKFEERRGAIGGELGRIVRLPGRGLIAMDEQAKGLVYHMELAALAYRAARDKGLKGEALEADAMARINAPTAEMQAQAMKESTRMTFQQDLAGASGRAINAIRRVPGMRYVVPFIRTPTNILKSGIAKTPLGAAVVAYHVAHGDYAGNSTRLNREIAEQMIAWGVSAIVMAAVMGQDDDEPWLTGSLPRDARQGERQYRQSNLPPQSFKAFGRWFSYSRIEPFATSLTLMIDAAQALRDMRENEDGASRAMGRLFAAVKNAVRDKTFLQGLGDIIAAIEDGQGLEGKAAQWGERFAGSWMPNIVRSPLRATDDNVRDRHEGKGTLNAAQAVGMNVLYQWAPLGGVAEVPWNQPVRLDHWGRPITRGKITAHHATDVAWRAIVPVRTQQVASIDNLDRMLWNWNRRLEQEGTPELGWWPNIPSDKMTIRGEKYDIDAETYRIMLEDRAKMVKSMALSRRFDYDNPSDMQVEVYRKIWEVANDRARARARGAVLTGNADNQ